MSIFSAYLSTSKTDEHFPEYVILLLAFTFCLFYQTSRFPHLPLSHFLMGKKIFEKMLHSKIQFFFSIMVVYTGVQKKLTKNWGKR